MSKPFAARDRQTAADKTPSCLTADPLPDLGLNDERAVSVRQAAPKAQLELAHVHGYRGSDPASDPLGGTQPWDNLLVNKYAELVYYVATVVVVQPPLGDEQLGVSRHNIILSLPSGLHSLHLGCILLNTQRYCC